MIIDNADFVYLLKWMKKPYNVDEEDYQKWRKDRKSEAPRERMGNRIYATDFQSYMKCARRLWFLSHEPKTKKSMINKSIYIAEKRHDDIEAYLKDCGWKTELRCEATLTVGKAKVSASGYIDGLSPSNFILDIKHKYYPTEGDKLQTGFYQKLLKPTETKIVLLYPNQVAMFEDVAKIIDKYLPRVYACIALDIQPPKHPSFPRCYASCEYYKECGRTRVRPKQKPFTEWNEWFTKIREAIY